MDITGIPTTGHGCGYGYGYNDNGNRIDHNTILRGLSDMRMENKEAECGILKSIADSSAMAAKDRADSTFRLHENIRNVADQILVSSNLTQAQVAQAAAAQALATEKSTATILAAISASELRQLQDELNETRLERSRYHSEVNFGNQFAILQSQLNSLDQVQRSTNQAINFGNGGIGPQTSTNNQVR